MKRQTVKWKGAIGVKKKIAFTMALFMLLMTLLTCSALASHSGSYQTAGGPNGKVTVNYTMSKNKPNAPNPITVTFNERMATTGLLMDSFKIVGSVALRNDTKTKTSTGSGSVLISMIDVSYGSTIVSATGKFYAYSNAFGNGYKQASCTCSEL